MALCHSSILQAIAKLDTCSILVTESRKHATELARNREAVIVVCAQHNINDIISLTTFA